MSLTIMYHKFSKNYTFKGFFHIDIFYNVTGGETLLYRESHFF